MQSRFLEWVASIREEHLYGLLEDLLESMGFESVHVTHGALEAGKDLVFRERDRFGRDLWRGIQVSKTKISASFSSSARAVRLLDQARVALKKPYTLLNGQRVKLHEVFVLTPFPVSEHVKHQVSEDLDDPRVQIVDGPGLYELVREYLPHLVQMGSASIEEYLRRLRSYCDTPEEFLSVRFHARFQLSEVFVPPECVVEIARPGVIRDLTVVPGDFSLEPLRQDIAAKRALLAARRLPALEVHEWVDVFRTLDKILQTARRMGQVIGEETDWMGEVEGFEAHVTALADHLGLDFPSIQQHGFGGAASCFPEVERHELLELEDELRAIDNIHVTPLVQYRDLLERERRQTEIRQKAHRLRGHDAGRTDQELRADRTREINLQADQRAEIVRERGNFFHKLSDGFNRTTDRSQSLVPVIVAASRLLLEKDRPSEKGRPANDGDSPRLPRGRADKESEEASATRYQEAVRSVDGFVESFRRRLVRSMGEYFDLYSHLEARLVERERDEGRAEPVTHESVVGQQVLREEDAKALGLLSELSQRTGFYREFGHLEADQLLQIPIDPFGLSASYPRSIFYAEMGMGKTTLLKQLCQRDSDRDGVQEQVQEPREQKQRDQDEAEEATPATGARHETDGRLPVFVSLGTLTPPSDDADLAKLLLQEAREDAGSISDFPQQKLRWFLDGLDEVASAQFREALLDWCSDPAEKSFLLASRPSAMPSYLPGTLRVALVGFTWEKKQEFVRRFPFTSRETGEALLSVLEREEELARISDTPLMLTLLSLLAEHHQGAELPRRRDQIYDSIFRMMLFEWDRAKGLIRKESSLNEEVRSHLVRRVAYHLYLLKKRAFRREELVDLACDVGSNLGLSVADIEVLFDEWVRDCLLLPLSRDQFGFFHLSMQEYLAGADLARDIHPTRVMRAIQEYLREGRWLEPLVFYAGIKRDVTDLINDLPGLFGSPERLRVLLERWLQVADFTRAEDLNPRGRVAQGLAEMNFRDQRDRWSKLAILK